MKNKVLERIKAGLVVSGAFPLMAAHLHQELALEGPGTSSKMVLRAYIVKK